MVKNLPVNARDMGSILGKISYTMEQLSPCATTTEPPGLEPVLRKRCHHNGKSMHHNEEQPSLAPARESPHAAMETQCSQKHGSK